MRTLETVKRRPCHDTRAPRLTSRPVRSRLEDLPDAPLPTARPHKGAPSPSDETPVFSVSWQTETGSTSDEGEAMAADVDRGSAGVCSVETASPLTHSLFLTLTRLNGARLSLTSSRLLCKGFYVRTVNKASIGIFSEKRYKSFFRRETVVYQKAACS